MSSPAPSFAFTLAQHQLAPLCRHTIDTVQVNVGKRCNQACHHCHVEAGPKRTEVMDRSTAERILHLLAESPTVRTLDLTGGAPELNPHFRMLVTEGRKLQLRVIDRCNLTILTEPGFEELASFLADNRVEIIASLPCYTEANVDRQRGRGVFGKSIEALWRLNRLGYGCSGGSLVLNLAYNPLGPSLPPPQMALETDYRRHLRSDFGIEFDHLFTITNMPIKRFSEQLIRIGQYESYQRLLIDHFNPKTLSQLMCRSQINIGWEGKLYDCDFNQMLELPTTDARTVWDIGNFDDLASDTIVTGHHCFGCTAGAGSSCGGTII